MQRLVLPFFLVLGACGAMPAGDMPSRAATEVDSAMPPMKSFSGQLPEPPRRSNRDIARDFIDLSMTLESGRALERFTRFEEPVTVRVTGAAPPTLVPDLDRLLARLRREAGIDISRVTGRRANITIEAVTRSQIRRSLPQAACFVVPNITSLSQYSSARHSRKTNWTQIDRRETLAIFVPGDAAPQEVRDCLHEELAQALGPLNDLYRLPNSVFNDDNVHTVLTGFDMLILRAYYAPELANGMSRAEVAARLPAILARLNPAGESRAPRPTTETPRAWIRAIQTALGPGTADRQRRAAAATALRIARSMGWTDHRRAFSHYALGRLIEDGDADTAQRHFAAADTFYRRTPGTDLHRAHAAAQLAGQAIREGDGRKALDILHPSLASPSATRTRRCWRR